MAGGSEQRRCPSCCGRLHFVDMEQNGDSAWICESCGDEWYGSTLDDHADLHSDSEEGRNGEEGVTYVQEGWWHPNCKDGQVHDHKPNQPATMHRLCEPVYTKRLNGEPVEQGMDEPTPPRRVSRHYYDELRPNG